MKLPCWLKHCIVVAGLALSVPAGFAHDAISAEARKSYLGKLDELHRTAQSSATPAARAAARFQTGKILTEIRGLLNEDIMSHGKTQGLETLTLVNQLNASPNKLAISSYTKLYLADLQAWRDAIALDPRAKHVTVARFMLFKDYFYDSFTDNPLQPIKEDKQTLLEMISLGELLLPMKDAAVDTEEVTFILAVHYLKAAESGALPKAKCQNRFAELLQKFKNTWADSLKLSTLEALSSP